MKYPDVLEEVYEMKLRVSNEVLEEMDEMLGSIPGPEKLIGKPYEEWAPQDIQLLSTVWPLDGDNKLTKLIVKKEIQAMQEARSLVEEG